MQESAHISRVKTVKLVYHPLMSLLGIAPGLRPHYHVDYYGAYFRNPDGNKLCVVCHEET